jgi:hypothetical protein
MVWSALWSIPELFWDSVRRAALGTSFHLAVGGVTPQEVEACSPEERFGRFAERQSLAALGARFAGEWHRGFRPVFNATPIPISICFWRRSKTIATRLALRGIGVRPRLIG